mgnify:FL=1|jgi:hypothetical protein|tara:strand:- start:714 stop:3098 length:2385 start_codon:yes stop_codon:yes gene_type:complete
MSKIKFVSCFNEEYLQTISIHFLNRVHKSWQNSIEFHFYYYDLDLKNYSLPKANNIYYHNLEEVEDYNSCIEAYKVHDGTEGNAIAYNRSLDAVRFIPKVMALTECAFNNTDGWLFWIDADTMSIKNIYENDLLSLLPEHEEKCDMVSLVNKEDDIEHFLEGFNLSRQTPVELLGDLRGAYLSGEFRNYREWHDGFILNRLITIYTAHGMALHKIPAENSIVSDMFIHLHGNTNIALRDEDGERVFELSDDETSPDILPNRYRQLADIIRFYKSKTLLETGTWNGGRAIEMALAALENSDEVHYIGYDLFENATIETDEEEFNVKPHNTIAAVQKRLEEFTEVIAKRDKKKFTFELHKGNVRDILAIERTDIDLAMLGSGNSIETVAHEYKTVKDIPVVVTDHYFTKDEDDNLPPDRYHGSKKVFDDVPTKKVDEQETTKDGWTTFDEKSTTRKYLLPSGDNVIGGGHTHLCLYLHDTELKECPDELKRVPIIVHPRDCVPQDYIQDNIKSNMKLIDKDSWIRKHPAHKETAIVVSAGPYIDFKELKKTIRQNKNSKVVCVKHSYPMLLENGIKPWMCTILDPRSINGTSTHGIVRKDLFKEIDKETLFMVASMTDPSVTEFLQDKDCQIWGWHAFTDSLRQEMDQGKEIKNQKVHIMDDLGIPKGATLITGGTCAAMRSIGMLHTMGFRDIHLFGYDCCLDEPTDEAKTETTGDIEGGETPRPKYFQVTVGDNTYWTTGELLAMGQDCEKVFSDDGMDGVLTMHGKDTMVADLWDLKLERDSRPLFEGHYDRV